MSRELIDRQGIIDALDHVIKNGIKNKYVNGHFLTAEAVKEYILALPSAQPEHTSNNDCNGCKFVGCYDTDFPCANCIRKNKDYYAPERKLIEQKGGNGG